MEFANEHESWPGTGKHVPRTDHGTWEKLHVCVK